MRESLHDPTAVTAPVFDEETYPLPGIDQLVSAGWPKNRDSLARAVLGLTTQAGARDMADDSTATRTSILQREYHHLFPDSILTGEGRLSAEESFRALNCVLITWKTNRKIAAKTPLVYLRERINAAALGEAVLRSRLRTHLVPFDLLAASDWTALTDEGTKASAIRTSYEAFLQARAILIQGPLTDLCNGKVPDWSVLESVAEGQDSEGV